MVSSEMKLDFTREYEFIMRNEAGIELLSYGNVPIISAMLSMLNQSFPQNLLKMDTDLR